MRTFTALFSAGALSLAFSTPALAQQPATAPAPMSTSPAAPQPTNLSTTSILVLVRSALTALNQANQTNNYSVLHDLGSPGFQAANSAAKLSQIFAAQRSAGLDLAGALVLMPTITLQPQIEANGALRLAGYFPVNSSDRLNFDLQFQFVGAKMLLSAITVNVAAGNASSPAVPAPTATTPAATTKPKSRAAPVPKPAAKPKPKPAPQAQ